MNLGTSEMVLILFVITLLSFIYVIPLWRILKRTGFHPAFSFLAIIPVVKLVALYYFAFSEWPNESKLNKTQQ
jgi:hypothetical protein